MNRSIVNRFAALSLHSRLSYIQPQRLLAPLFSAPRCYAHQKGEGVADHTTYEGNHIQNLNPNIVGLTSGEPEEFLHRRVRIYKPGQNSDATVLSIIMWHRPTLTKLSFTDF